MIRQLKPGEQLPEGEPRRYKAASGYIRLRWKVGKGEYVETYGHRVDGDRVTTAAHVHHINRRRDDNRPENLLAVSTAEHGEHHRSVDDEDIRRRYLAGETTINLGRAYGVDPSVISKSLKRTGTKGRHGGQYLTRVEARDVAWRYLSGHSLESLADYYDTSVGVIVARLNELGVKRRRVGRPASPRSSAVVSVTAVDRGVA